MTPNQFYNRVTKALKQLPFVENVFLSEKEEYVRGHAELKWELSLNIFYHSTSLKFNFALHNNKERLWAID